MEESKQVYSEQVPREIKKWNWGAFVYNIVWGVGNNSYLPLLCFIPFFNIIWIFVCGAKGNEWAWKKGEYNSVEEFMKVQKTWNRAGLFAFCLSILGVILYFFFIASIMAAFMAY